MLARAWSHWQWSVLWTTLTPTGGGLRDQILGTLILMLGVFIIAGTIGVLAGIHLAELARPRQLSGKAAAAPLRTASDILSGFPSIVLGYVGYVALVVGPALGLLAPRRADHPLHHGDPLHRQDDRELAAPGPDRLPGGGRGPRACRWATACARWCSRARCRASSPGSCWRWPSPCGETAPLIYTAGFANTLPHSLTHAQFPYLTYVVFTYYNAPETQYHYLSYDAALILVVIVLLLLVSSRIIVARTQRHSESARGTGRGSRRRRRQPLGPEPTCRGRSTTRCRASASTGRPAERRPPGADGDPTTRRNVERRT